MLRVLEQQLQFKEIIVLTNFARSFSSALPWRHLFVVYHCALLIQRAYRVHSRLRVIEEKSSLTIVMTFYVLHSNPFGLLHVFFVFRRFIAKNPIILPITWIYRFLVKIVSWSWTGRVGLIPVSSSTSPENCLSHVGTIGIVKSAMVSASSPWVLSHHCYVEFLIQSVSLHDSAWFYSSRDWSDVVHDSDWLVIDTHPIN